MDGSAVLHLSRMVPQLSPLMMSFRTRSPSAGPSLLQLKENFSSTACASRDSVPLSSPINLPASSAAARFPFLPPPRAPPLPPPPPPAAAAPRPIFVILTSGLSSRSSMSSSSSRSVFKLRLLSVHRRPTHPSTPSATKDAGWSPTGNRSAAGSQDCLTRSARRRGAAAERDGTPLRR